MTDDSTMRAKDKSVGSTEKTRYCFAPSPCSYCETSSFDDEKGAYTRLGRCSGCKSVMYCSPAHQKLDWKNHKAECKTLAAQLHATQIAISSDTVLNPERFELVLREIERVFLLTDVYDLEYREAKCERVKKMIKRLVDWPGCASALQGYEGQHDDSADINGDKRRDSYYTLKSLMKTLEEQMACHMRRYEEIDPNHCQAELDDNLRIVHQICTVASENVQKALALDLWDFVTLKTVYESTLLRYLQDYDKARAKYETAVLRGGPGLYNGGGVYTLHQTIKLIQKTAGIELSVEYTEVTDGYFNRWHCTFMEKAHAKRYLVNMGRALVGLHYLAMLLSNISEGCTSDDDEPYKPLWIAKPHWRLMRMAHWTAVNTLTRLLFAVARDDFQAFSGGVSVLIEYFLCCMYKKSALMLAEMVIAVHACGPECWDLVLAKTVLQSDGSLDPFCGMMNTAHCECEATNAEEWALLKRAWPDLFKKLSKTLTAMRPEETYPKPSEPGKIPKRRTRTLGCACTHVHQ